MANSLRNYRIFRDLTETQISTLKQNSSIVRYAPKEAVFLEGSLTSHVMFLKSGLLKTYKENKNKSSVLINFITPENLVGLSSVLGDEVFHFSCSAVEASEVMIVDISFFQQLVHENTAFNQKIIEHISKDALSTFNKLIKITYKHLPGRIADVLLFFSEELYESLTFRFPVTRKELAEFSGTTTESFIRTINEFKNDRIIDIQGSDITILSIDIVRTLSKNG